MRGVPESGRGSAVSLTAAGVDAQRAHSIRLNDVERQWEKQFGSVVVDELRTSLEDVLASASFPEALVTPPGGWRGKGRYAKLTAQFHERPRQSLPQYPMVLHRGGWPDGS